MKPYGVRQFIGALSCEIYLADPLRAGILRDDSKAEAADNAASIAQEVKDS